MQSQSKFNFCEIGIFRQLDRDGYSCEFGLYIIVRSQINVQLILILGVNLVPLHLLPLQVPIHNRAHHEHPKHQSEVLVRLHFELLGPYLFSAEGQCGLNPPLVDAQCQRDAQQETVHETEVMERVIHHHNRQDALPQYDGPCNLFILLHLKSCIVVVIVVYPADTVEVLVLPRHHVHEQRERLHHADTPPRCRPPQIYGHGPNDRTHKSVHLGPRLHPGVDEEVAEPDGGSYACGQWVVVVQAAQPSCPQRDTQGKGNIRVYPQDERSLGGSEHLLVEFYFDVLIERLGGHRECN